MKFSRHLAKAITWRILATSTTMTVAYIVTGEFRLSLTIGVIESVAKVVLYVIHDYLWEMPHVASV